MTVANHLHIPLDEYDARIRTFVPGYEELIGNAAGALRLVSAASPVIIDLGIGTGALAAACLELRSDASLVGFDSDPGMLKAADARLARFARVRLEEADFTAVDLPACDAFVACISLHHIRTPDAKRAFYAKCHHALRPAGIFVSADCFPARHAALATLQREAWLAHLEAGYGRAEAESHLASWAGEDVYFPLETELEWLRAAGFEPEVIWRRDGFAVVAAFA